MATLTTYSTEDAFIYRNAVDESWATIRAGAGLGIDRTSASIGCNYFDTNGAASNNWSALSRNIYTFDTSSIGSGQTVTSATISFWGVTKVDGVGIAPNFGIFGATPASQTLLVAADFSQTGTTAYVDTYLSWASYTTGVYNDLTLNTTGCSAINITGNTSISLKNQNYDAANSAPTWATAAVTYAYFYSRNQTGTTNDPKLVVNYSASGGTSYRRMATLGVGQ